MAQFPAISLSATVRLTDRQVACAVADEMVILHLHEGVYYGLNSVGACVWRQVQGSCRVDQIVDAVMAEFDVTRDRCVADVYELLQDLQKHELLTVSGSS